VKLNAAAQMKLDAVDTVLWTVFQCERIAEGPATGRWLQHS